MATSNERLNLIVSAKNQADSALNSLKNQIIGIGAAYLAWGSVKNIIGGIVSAGMESEKMWGDVTAALRRHDIEVDNNIKRIQRFADQMQTLSGVSDEVIGKSVQAFIDYGQTVDEAMNTTRVAMDLAAGGGMDFKAATDLLAKAAVGYTGTLSRYGIIIDENIPKSEKFAAAIEQINQRFGGAATARADMFATRLDVLNQKWGDLQENFAEDLMPVFQKSINAGIGLLDGFTMALNNTDTQGGQTETAVKELRAEILRLEQINAPQEAIDELKVKLQELETQLNATKEATKKAATEWQDFWTGTGILIVKTGDAIKDAYEWWRKLGDYAGETDIEKVWFGSHSFLGGIKSSITLMGTATRTAKEFTDAFGAIGTTAAADNTEAIAAEIALQAQLAKRAEIYQYIKDNIGELEEYASAVYTEMSLMEEEDAAQTKMLTDELMAKNNEYYASWIALNEILMGKIQETEDAERAAAVRMMANMANIFGRFVDSTVDMLVEGRGEMADIFQAMAKDFIKLFIKKALEALGNILIPGIMKLLTMFDVPENDRMAMTQGRHFAGFFVRGALDEFAKASLGPQILSRTSPFAVSGAMPMSMPQPLSTSTTNTVTNAPSIVLQFNAPITSQQFVKDHIIPAIEEASRTLYTRIPISEYSISGAREVRI